MDAANIPAKSEVRNLTCSRDDSDCFFGLGLCTAVLGYGRPQGVGDGAVGKSVGDFL